MRDVPDLAGLPDGVLADVFDQLNGLLVGLQSLCWYVEDDGVAVPYPDADLATVRLAQWLETEARPGSDAVTAQSGGVVSVELPRQLSELIGWPRGQNVRSGAVMRDLHSRRGHRRR